MIPSKFIGLENLETLAKTISSCSLILEGKSELLCTNTHPQPSQEAGRRWSEPFCLYMVSLRVGLVSPQPSFPSYLPLTGSCYCSCCSVSTNNGQPARGRAERQSRFPFVTPTMTMCCQSLKIKQLMKFSSHSDGSRGRLWWGSRLWFPICWLCVPGWLQSCTAGTPSAPSASLFPDCLPAEQTAFPDITAWTLSLQDWEALLPQQKGIKFSAGFEGGMKANNSWDRNLLKINHKRREMWHNSPLYCDWNQLSVALNRSYLQKFLCCIALWH